MPTPVVLDVVPLLDAIPGANPAGVKPTLAQRKQLKDWATDFDPEKDLTDEERADPRFQDAKRVVPQWDKVIQFGQQFLTQTGKDLTVVLVLVEALTRRHGFGGLRDGLTLLRDVCDRCWDALHPIIEDPNDRDEIDGRLGLFSYLDDELSLPRFPNSIREVPVLVPTRGEPISFRDCQPSGYEKARVPPDQLKLAIQTADSATFERVRSVADDLAAVDTVLTELMNVLQSKVTVPVPSFSGLRRAVQDCQAMAVQILRSDPSSGSSSTDTPSETGTEPATDSYAGGTAVASVGRSAAVTRDDIYARLAELADALEQLEPHSPVPLVIRRAVEMRNRSFPELVDKLTDATRTLMQFVREPLPEG